MSLSAESQATKRKGMGASESNLAAGYVSSLEVIPFLSWAAGSGIRMQSCPGYGNMVRGLLTGILDAGLIPWELFVTDLLSRPGQTRLWRVPLVLKACPMELALSRSARKLVYPVKQRLPASGSVELTFGVEGKHSFTKHQIVAWMESIGARHLGVPRFKVLPMGLMVKALELGEIDGFLAPSPWGLQAEVDGLGQIEAKFDGGDHAQKLVLVCNGPMNEQYRRPFGTLPDEFRQGDALESGSKALLEWSSSLAGGSAACPSSELFEMAAKRYPLHQLQDEFVPDFNWFERELEALVLRRAISMKMDSIHLIAKTLGSST